MRPSTSFNVESKDGTRIFINAMNSEKPQTRSIRNVLVIIHGYGEHGGRYQHLPHYLADEFDIFYAIDLRGHGRSAGLRGHAPSMKAISEDIHAALDEIQKKEPDSQFVLFAHSFGGLVGLTILYESMTPNVSDSETATKKLPFKAAIISAPLIDVAMPVPPILKKIAKVLNSTFSIIQLSSELNPMHLSHDPKVSEAFIKDRLVHTKITPRMYFSMLDGMEWIKKQTGDLPCPVLFIVPGDDHIVSAQSTRDYYKSIQFKDKTIIEYPGLFHELVNELEKDKVFADIKKWLQK